MPLPDQLHHTAFSGELASPPPQYEAVVLALSDIIDLQALSRLDMSLGVEDLVRSRSFYGYEGVVMSPLEPAHSMWEHARHFDKLEVEQSVRAFKARGAYAGGEAAMHEHPTLRHLITHSAGNHGLGVAQFVKSWNIRTGAVQVDREGNFLVADENRMLYADIFVPDGASVDKQQRLLAFRNFGARLHVGGADLGEAHGRAMTELTRLNASQPVDKPLAKEIHPYRDPHVMAGQATALLETVLQLRDYYGITNEVPLHYYVGCGGKGLLNGSGVLLGLLKRFGIVHPDSKVVGAQMEKCDSGVRGLQRLRYAQSAGLPVDLSDLFITNDGKDEFDPTADGTAVRDPDLGNLLLTQFLQRLGHVDEIRTVSKPEVAKTMRIHRAKPEPAGALGATAARVYEESLAKDWIANGPLSSDYAAVVSVISGGNRSAETVDHFAKFETGIGQLAVLSAPIIHSSPAAPRPPKKGPKPLNGKAHRLYAVS